MLRMSSSLHGLFEVCRWGLFRFFFGAFWRDFLGATFAKTCGTVYFGLNNQLVGTAVNNGYSLRTLCKKILSCFFFNLTRYESEMINMLFPDAGFA